MNSRDIILIGILAFLSFLAIKNLIAINLLIYIIVYTFIAYMFYFNFILKGKDNPKLFFGIGSSLGIISYLKPTSPIFMIIPLLILSIFFLINLYIRIKNYKKDKNENSYAIVFISMIMIVSYSLIIIMKFK